LSVFEEISHSVQSGGARAVKELVEKAIAKGSSAKVNVSLSKTFRGYINEFRLTAVCRDLLLDPRHSILDIGFSNGFNSKSSFNALFFRKY
jgi:AraC-like DNA-binding protein